MSQLRPLKIPLHLLPSFVSVNRVRYEELLNSIGGLSNVVIGSDDLTAEAPFFWTANYIGKPEDFVIPYLLESFTNEFIDNRYIFLRAYRIPTGLLECEDTVMWIFSDCPEVTHIEVLESGLVLRVAHSRMTLEDKDALGKSYSEHIRSRLKDFVGYFTKEADVHPDVDDSPGYLDANIEVAIHRAKEKGGSYVIFSTTTEQEVAFIRNGVLYVKHEGEL